MIEFLRTQFRGERDTLDVPEHWPRFVLADDGDIQRVPEIESQLQPQPPPLVPSAPLDPSR